MAVTDEAIEKIKAMIVAGDLRPGDRLPREAVKALSLIRVLDVRQGDGTYVTSLAPQLLLDALNFIVDFHRDDTVLEFFEVRRILEPAATALAAQRMTDDDVHALRKVLAGLRDDAGIDELVANDLEFHHRIASGAGNALLCSLIDSLSGPTTRARIWRGLTQAGAVERTREQHAAILDAIATRRPELARSWATVHVAGVEDWLRVALKGA